MTIWRRFAAWWSRHTHRHANEPSEPPFDLFGIDGPTVRHDAATTNEVMRIISAVAWLPLTHRVALANRFLDWHYAHPPADTGDQP